jgi:hypothetical protein
VVARVGEGVTPPIPAPFYSYFMFKFLMYIYFTLLLDYLLYGSKQNKTYLKHGMTDENDEL